MRIILLHKHKSSPCCYDVDSPDNTTFSLFYKYVLLGLSNRFYLLPWSEREGSTALNE